MINRLSNLLCYALYSRPLFGGLSPTLWNNPSDMILNIHSNASYLSETKARSRAGGIFYLSNNSKNPPLNGAIMSIAASCALYLHLQGKQKWEPSSTMCKMELWYAPQRTWASTASNTNTNWQWSHRWHCQWPSQTMLIKSDWHAILLGLWSCPARSISNPLEERIQKPSQLLHETPSTSAPQTNVLHISQHTWLSRPYQSLWGCVDNTACHARHIIRHHLSVSLEGAKWPWMDKDDNPFVLQLKYIIILKQDHWVQIPLVTDIQFSIARDDFHI